jgi:hypothetical protein
MHIFFFCKHSLWITATTVWYFAPPPAIMVLTTTITLASGRGALVHKCTDGKTFIDSAELLQRIMAGAGSDYDNVLAEKLGDNVSPLACAICGQHMDKHTVVQNNGALTQLDVSNNDIGAEQEGNLQQICMTSGIELAM